jgi:hypothetical protein
MLQSGRGRLARKSGGVHTEEAQRIRSTKEIHAKPRPKNGFAQPGFKDGFSDCLPEPRVEVDQHSDAYLYRRKVGMKRIQNVIVLLG